jgi:DNA-binding transcriptional ArsR family regulator
VTEERESDRCQVTRIEPERVCAAQEQLVEGLVATRLAALFRVLGDPTRVRMISALAIGELCVCDLSAAVGMSQSAISHQLRTLRQLRLVKRRRDGQMAYYSIDDDHVVRLFREGMDHVLHE